MAIISVVPTIDRGGDSDNSRGDGASDGVQVVLATGTPFASFFGVDGDTARFTDPDFAPATVGSDKAELSAWRERERATTGVPWDRAFLTVLFPLVR